MSFKYNVLNAICSLPTKWINLTFQNRVINQISYGVAAQFIDDGRIQCKVDREKVGGEGAAAIYDPDDDTIYAPLDSYGERFFDEKSVLVHEVTHAILDYYGGLDMNMEKSSMLVLNDETIAYLAQAIYAIAAKNSLTQASPLEEAVAIARPKVDVEKLDMCKSIIFSGKEIEPLQDAIRRHKLYEATISDIALHNGLKRPKPESSPF